MVNNSSVALDVSSLVDVQSTLKTFTSSQSSTGNSGTTTISSGIVDDGKVVVANRQ